MGTAFVLRTILMILAPAYASPLLLAPAILGILPLTIWLLVRGVDADRWRQLDAQALATASQ
jgi:hypothetical protein